MLTDAIAVEPVTPAAFLEGRVRLVSKTLVVPVTPKAISSLKVALVVIVMLSLVKMPDGLA